MSSERTFALGEEMVERAAAALYGELLSDGIKESVAHGSFDKETLRLSVRRVLAAAADPLWGKR